MPSKKESVVHPWPYLLEISLYKSKAGNSAHPVDLFVMYITDSVLFISLSIILLLSDPEFLSNIMYTYIVSCLVFLFCIT